MATATLVDERIEDGERFIALLASHDFDVTAACWVKTSNEGRWLLYLVSKAVDENRSAAVGDAYRLAASMPDSAITFFALKVIGTADPIAASIMQIQRRHPDGAAVRVRETRLGNLPIEEGYLLAPVFKGFDEIKWRFPSASAFAIMVPFPEREHKRAEFWKIVEGLRGRINRADFNGREPETVWFAGAEVFGNSPLARLLFVHRPEGWNKLFDAETGSWEEVARADTGKRLYEAADFAPLAALRTAN